MTSKAPAPSALAPDSLVGQQVGGYLVEEPLGEGGMGLVYRARHPLLNRHFAIKVLRPEIAADAASSRNFAREAETLSRLKHPSIIDIVGFGPLADGRQYIVMEYLIGRTLERELAEQGRMEPERALALCDEMLDALSAAHSVDVIHRDLKPSNVFLARVSGGRELVKLLDFGLAKQQPAALLGESAAAGVSVIAGTPEYIAPEQARGQAANRQSDLYSFGVMLFEMLTGTLPFRGSPGAVGSQRIRELMTKHVHQPAPTLHETAPGVHFPVGLEEIVADLLRKTPQERPSSADTVRQRLRGEARRLAQEATQLRTNPLLDGAPEGLSPVTVRLPMVPPSRGGPMKEARPTAAGVGRTRVLLFAGALAVLLLGSFSWWLLHARDAGPSPAAAPPHAAPVVAEPLPPPVPPAEEPEEALAPAIIAVVPSVHPRPARRVAPGPVAPRVDQQRAMPAPAPGCAPDAAWKKGARADLNAFVTRAARRGAELSLWAADREGPLSEAIEAATSRVECGAVALRLAMFKEKVMEP